MTSFATELATPGVTDECMDTLLRLIYKAVVKRVSNAVISVVTDRGKCNVKVKCCNASNKTGRITEVSSKLYENLSTLPARVVT